MTRIAAMTMEEMPSPIKPREDSLSSNDQVLTPRPPPSPLETEVDSEGGPSSVEAQADPNDLSFDQRVDKVSRSLTQNNWDVLLIGRRLSNSKKLDRNYKTHRISLIFNNGFLFYAEYNLRLFFFLLLKKVHVLHANDLDTLLPMWLLSKVKKVPLVYDSHEFFLGVPEIQNKKMVKFIWKLIERIIFPRLKHVFTVNESIAKLYQNAYNVNVKVLRNVPEQTKIDLIKTKSNLNLPSQKPVVILQGSGINVDRGAEELLEAIALQDQFFLCVIGKGDVFEKLRERALRQDLSKKTMFIDAIPYEEMMQYTMLSDIGVSLDKPNNLNYEFSLPNKFFDYIKAGIPVVSSHLIEIRKLVEQFNCGAMTTSHDPHDILDALQYAFKNKSSFKKGILQAKEELVWEKEVINLINCYQAIA